jgi:hypothetical protein
MRIRALASLALAVSFAACDGGATTSSDGNSDDLRHRGRTDLSTANEPRDMASSPQPDLAHAPDLSLPPGPGKTYSVKQGGGGDFTTIQACASAIAAGDTCVVYAGTYAENVTLPAGSAGGYKTLTVNPGDLAYVLSVTIHSHDRLDGFHIQNPAKPYGTDCVTISAATTDFYVTNNVISQCGAHAAIYEPTSSPVVSHGFILNNTISYPCSPASGTIDVCGGLQLQASHHLIEGNDISHVSDGFANFSGDHNIIRKNTMHDTSTSDCVPGGHGSNCHIDFLETEPNVVGGGIPSQFNVIEGNTELNNLGTDGHGWLSQGDACNGQCFNLINRFNVGAHVGSGGILDDNAGNHSVAVGYYNVKVYNDTWVDYNASPGSQLYGGTSSFTNHSTGGAQINNLFYYPESLADFNPYMSDTSSQPFSPSHNLAWCTGATCNMHGSVYGSGKFTDDPGNRVADPQFVSYAANDFRLAATSPALNAGTYLTTVAAADHGSGSSLVVSDAGFFQDGYGIAGVGADCIAVTTVGQHVCITAVDYATHTLTLASAITRAPGDAVWLYSDSAGRVVLPGSAPNIGATFAK